MKKLLSLFLALLSVFQMLLLSGCNNQKTKYTDYSFDYFDTVTNIVGYENTKEEFDAVCEKIKVRLQEYHRLYNIYNRYEGVNNLCMLNEVKGGAHKELTVESKIIDLLDYSLEMYNLTNGKVNVAMGSVLSIWHEYRQEGLDNPENAKLPDILALKSAAEHTDINGVVIDKTDSTVYLSDPEMKLDVGAIAKGYAVEETAKWMENEGIGGYILNVGGNVRIVGTRPDGEKWKVGIENPDTENEDEPYIAYLGLDSVALVTSGSYQRYYTVDGKRYHHIIDPETLMPGENFNSVSVLCESSAKADALSTALFSMTYEEGKALIESIPDTEAMWVLPSGEQRYSSGFEDYLI